jgi:hypothetical protein
MTRPVNKLKEDIKHQVEIGKLNIGVQIAPKIVKTNIINDDGKMVDKTYSVYGRKIPLKQILEEMTEEQIRMGIIRWNKDRIDIIGMTEVTIFSLKLMNQFLMTFIFLVCKIAGAGIDARYHNTMY